MKGKVRWNEGGKDERGHRKEKKEGAMSAVGRKGSGGLLSHFICLYDTERRCSEIW